MKKTLLLLSVVFSQIGIINAQNVYIPDANFKADLLADVNINTNMNMEIEVTEATAYSGAIECPALAITNLTGIEAFVNLTQLQAQSNNISAIDLSANTNLTYVRFSNHQITSLNLGINPNLVQLDLYNCGLTSFDATNTPSIASLVLAYNPLTVLDLSMLTGLSYLTCNNGQLTALNIANGNNSNITYIDARNNTNLGCIEVDDVTYSTNNWIANPYLFDAGATWATFCSNSASLNDLNTTVNLQLYPNPAKEFIRIIASQPTTGTVMGINGAFLSTLELSGETTIDVSTYAPGVYFIRTAEGQTVKFIKE